MSECLALLVVQYAIDNAIVILFTPTLLFTTLNVFHNNCFVKFKVFASTVVFKFQIKTESKDIQHRLLILVVLSDLRKFVGGFDLSILIMFLKYKIKAVTV